MSTAAPAKPKIGLTQEIKKKMIDYCLHEAQTMWDQGDLIKGLDNKDVKELALIVHRGFDTLVKRANVAKAIPESLRDHSLAWGVYAELVRLEDGTDKWDFESDCAKLLDGPFKGTIHEMRHLVNQTLLQRAGVKPKSTPATRKKNTMWVGDKRDGLRVEAIRNGNSLTVSVITDLEEITNQRIIDLEDPQEQRLALDLVPSSE